MAKSTPSEKRYAKRYYETHPKEKEKKIKKQIAKQRANPKKFAKEQRDRYRDNKEYRDYKIKYAKDYYKRKKTSTNTRKRAKV